MSRIGKRPIKISEGVSVEITPTKVITSCGDKKLELTIPSCLKVNKVNEDSIVVDRNDDTKVSRSMHGLTMRLLTNLIKGVKEGFKRELEFTGTGYRVATDAGEIILNMGYSHEIRLPIPKGLEVAVKKNNITISGSDKQQVGEFAAKIRDVRGPEVYKGKGIKYKEEIIKRKAGKKAAK